MSSIINGAGSAVLPQSGAKNTVTDPRQILQTKHSGGAENADKKKDAGESSARQKFLDFMEKTPEQRMIEQWLSAHGLTKEQFDALPPEDKEEILEEMQADFKRQAEEELEKKNPGITGSLAGGLIAG